MNSRIITERTSKALKVQLLLSTCLFWFGIVPLLFVGTFYWWAVVIGGVWYMITKALIWWHHE